MEITPGAVKGILDSSGVSYKENSISYILACPRCEKKQKLYIRKKDGRFVCWVCKETSGFQGKPEFVLAELSGRTIKDLRESLYGKNQEEGELFLEASIKDFFGFEEDEVPLWVDELDEMLPDPGFRPLPGTKGAKYLESRGIPLDIALSYGIQYWPAKSRVIFPVSTHGKLLGWQARYVDPIEEEDRIPKALTSVGLKKDRTFMFSDRIKGEHMVLCEGPIDAIKADLCGGNVASLGKAVSDHQMNIIRHSGIKKLYLALDPDAFLESKRILAELVDEMEVYDMRPPAPYGDLGEMPFQEVFQLFKQAKRLDKSHLFLYLKNYYGK